MTVPEVMAIGEYGNNANMIAACAHLGYIEGGVLDLTYGEGAFWSRFRPGDLVTNDINPNKAADHHHDARMAPWPTGSFDTVVFDPPYKLAGRRGDAGQSDGGTTMDGRYGTEDYMPVAAVMDLLAAGTTEACRLSRKWVLVKCQDQVCSGRVHWQTDHVTEAARDAGFRKVDALMLKRSRAQDPKRRQLHARRNYSTLLVFGKR